MQTAPTLPAATTPAPKGWDVIKPTPTTPPSDTLSRDTLLAFAKGIETALKTDAKALDAATFNLKEAVRHLRTAYGLLS